MIRNTLALCALIALVLPLDVFYDFPAWGAEIHQPKTKELRDEARPKNHVETMVVTAYYKPDPTEKNYQKEVRMNGTGKTSSGYPLEIGIAAANPLFLPFGTKLKVPNLGTVVVRDTVGDKKPNHLDIFFGTGPEAKKKALKWGRRKIRIERESPDTPTITKESLMAFETCEKTTY